MMSGTEEARERLTRARGRDAVASAIATATAIAPLRVLIVAPSLDILGGQAVQAERLIERLREEPSLDVTFLPINPPFPKALAKVQGVKYVRSIRTTLLYWATLLARVRKYDVIHIFSASYLSFLISPTPALLAARFYGKKSVLNYHSGQAEEHLKSWKRTAIPTIRLADMTIVQSEYLVDVFARFGLTAHAIFNHIETERFRFRERRDVRPLFLSNRNLEPIYNVGCVLRAFALVQQRFPDARLTVAGDGSQRAELEKLARDLNLRHVEFTGLIAPDKMVELYDAADIFLNGSEVDNMPLSLLEAFAAGLPVVTTNAGGIPYIVADEETGFVIPMGDHAAMAERAIRLLTDNELALKMTKRAREECARYSWAAVRNKWLGVYQALAHERVVAGNQHAACDGASANE
ncbi:MAG TPA: glycosyltransferase family 4 protein [Pyrinomonadaceae bacterium]|nr:glycosyltransferase family 4 protein [Pyrinomonadaceae bacterium]